jgi:hypothetical protein
MGTSRVMLALSAVALLAACGGDPPPFATAWSQNTSRVVTSFVTNEGVDGEVVRHQRPYLLDQHGRYVTVNGVNLSGSTKFPRTEAFPGTGDLVSYVGKPFPVDEAHAYFAQIAGLGFNAVRLLAIWEAIEPEAKGEYDEAYLDYYEEMVRIAGEHGIYVLVDMHQDLFSRHLYAYYNEETAAPHGSLEEMILSMVPSGDPAAPFSDWVRGDGAPRWVLEAIMPEKDFDSPHYGTLRLLGALEPALMQALFDNLDLLPEDLAAPGALDPLITVLMETAAAEGIAGDTVMENLDVLMAAWGAVSALGGDDGAGLTLPDWVGALVEGLPGRFGPEETTTLLPWTFWGINYLLDLDVDRAYAAFFAGDTVFPDLAAPGGGSLQDYLQGAYTDAFTALARRTRKYDNVIGYDLMNEPSGFFIMLTLASAAATLNDPVAVSGVLADLLGEELGPQIYTLATGLQLIPRDASPETLAAWGLDGVDWMAALGLNLSFDAEHLQPFYERVGKAIQREDPNAIIWFEPSAGFRMLMEPMPQWDQHLTRLDGIDQMVYAPHHYFDIYPNPGFNEDPRDFIPEEWTYRDFVTKLGEVAAVSPEFLGNVPVVFGEFGTYFNFGGVAASEADGYAVSARILDRYYEAFEDLGVGRMLWCFSPENTAAGGDGWNKEDFSILGPDGQPRGWSAYVRPYARATSGKPLRSHFYSQHHYGDPDKGEAVPEREFELEMASKESPAPTELFVPRRQYPEGFYVWLSDGAAYYDDARQMLYWYPSRDAPGVVHRITIRPPLPGQDVSDWSYFFREDFVLNGKGGVR